MTTAASVRAAEKARTDKYYVYRPMLDLIGFTEGTDKGDGYNETLAYGAYTGGAVDLISMTLAQLDALQTKMLRHPRNSLKSSACGRYQIVRTTTRSIRDKLPARYPATRKFDGNCQDEMACYLLGLRGIDKYLVGRLSEDALIDNLAQEWASLPTTEGKGYYGGQHAAVKPARVRDALAEVRRRHAEGQPARTVEVAVPVEKPVVPEAVEQTVKEKSAWLTWLTGGTGSGLLGLGWLTGMDWRAILAGGGVLLVFVFVLFVLRRQIIAAVREISAELSP